MPANAKVGRVLGPAAPQSKSMAVQNNPPAAWDAALYREPDHFVYIYSVSDRSFQISQPPLVSNLNIPARKEGERYIRVCTIPHPFNQYDRESGNGEVIVRAHVGELVAASLVNPNNPTLDQDMRVPDGATLGLGVDLTAQGVFWSLNDPPTEQELMKAEKRRERYYRGLIERARTLEISNPQELEFLINQDYHMAAEFFGIETGWHKKYQLRAECPACGETIKPGVAYHKNSMGILCIVDAKRAADAGVTAQTQIPS